MISKTLYKNVRSALLNDWDPIGIKSIPEAQNEYDAYVPKLCELLESNKNRSQIFDCLWYLKTKHMGLSGNRQATDAFVDKLMRQFEP